MSGHQQYLLAVYIAEERDGPPVASGTVADAVDRSPGTATEAFHTLAEEGLVEYEPYVGATLTEKGRERAADLHEAYVTLSWFFRSALDLADHEAEAMELAATVSPNVAERLAATLLEAESEE
jgi:DtxR family Mn-dependent transcriptional regulator